MVAPGDPKRRDRRAVFNTDRMLGEYLDEAYLAVGPGEQGRRRT